jgi:GNAT superfamily N-acetyltransferase
LRQVRDEDLFERSVATLIESWLYLASGSPGAELTRVGDAAIAAFVHRPDREFLNNTLLGPRPAGLGPTVAVIEETYARHGVERFAIWVHESEAEVAAELRARGYAFDSATRTMAMPVDELGEVDGSALEVIEPGPAEFWAVDGPDGLVPDLDPAGAHFYVARLDGENASMLMAFDHAGDCGIYMLGTVEAARRRGIATALSAHAVTAARERGCLTASLQSTAMAERVYARVGFRDFGLWNEYVPAGAAREGTVD